LGVRPLKNIPLKRKVIRKDQMPDFPEFSFEPGWRKIIDIQMQVSRLPRIGSV
jgi:hypothetical protein